MENIKIKLIRIMACLLVITLCSFEKQEVGGINFFQGTLKEALEKAKTENKLVFFDAYASWCGPCQAMDREVFTDKDLGKYFNNRFVSIRIDMEKGEGLKLAERYFTSVHGYPSLFFLTSKGYLIKAVFGSRHTEELWNEAKLVK